jgi:Uma2 family endonuclease
VEVVVKAAEMLRWLRRNEWWGDAGESVVVPLGRPATIDDLRITKLKAEIVDGQLVVIGPSGGTPGHAAGAIAFSLDQHGGRSEKGRAFGARVAYLVDLPNRRALCPDASWYVGPRWDDFPVGAPVFAAEVRDAIDYSSEAERRMAAKRADYFAAGTLVVWDVDVLRECVIRVYRVNNPEEPAVYRRGEVAEAEPAVPGWRMPVDELFD